MGVFILATQKSWFLSLFRALFAFLDFLVYTVVRILFKTMFQLSNFELAGFYEPIQQRVYVILGIFMLFKVTVSLLTYLVNPDKITDKEQGAGKLVTRIITVLVMLIMLPNAFALLTEFQNKLVPVIPKIIVGTSFASENEGTQAENAGTTMTTTIINGFAPVDESCSGKEPFSNIDDFFVNVNETCPNSTYFAYDYKPVISTIVGVLMCYVLVSLCISVAIRAFKLIILRMIAPIPVISYVDPKSSKDGMFSTWIKTFLTTWAELFIYIGLIYFIIFMIDFLLSGDAWKGFFSSAGTNDPLEYVLLLAFVLIGLLFFAKQAPKFVFDALGIKTKGNFTRMLGMGTAALGMGGSVASSFKNRNKYDEEKGKNPNYLKNFGASLLNGLASGSAAGDALLSADKPTLRTGFDAQTKYNASNLANINSGIGLANRAVGAGTSLLFGSTPLDDMDRQIKADEARASNAKQLKEYMVGEGKKKTAMISQTGLEYLGTDGKKHALSNYSLDQVLTLKDEALANGTNIELTDAGGNKVSFGANSSTINSLIGDLEEGAGRLYAQKVNAGEITDPGALDSFRKTLADNLGITVNELKHYKQRDNDGNFVKDSAGNIVEIDLYNDPSKIKIIEKQSQTKAFKTKNSAEYSDAQKIYGKKN